MTDGIADRSPTRVALRIADGPGPAFLVAATEAIQHVSGAEVVLIISSSSVRSRRSKRHRIFDAIDAMYDRLERKALQGGPGALKARAQARPASGADILANATVAAQAQALAAASVDVLIELGLDDEMTPLPIPAGGRWRIRFAVGDAGPRRSRLLRPGQASAVAESLLSIDLASGQAFEAESGVGALRRVGFGRDRDAIYWRASMLPARRLARLVAGDAVASVGVDRAVTRTTAHRVGAEASSHPPIIGLAIALASKVLDRLLFRSNWVVLVRARTVDQAPPVDLVGFEVIPAPAGRFYADPFVLSTSSGPQLYVEDCPVGEHRGRITVLRAGKGGHWEHERVTLEDLDHRAYPHLLRIPEGVVVTPDGGRRGGVDIFIDRGLGAGLEHLGHCLEGVPASDPTLLWDGGRFWLFVAVTGYGMTPWDELHLYSAAMLDGLWHPHPRNPIVADVRRARPAGRIFRSGPDLIRPGQDCSVAYGQRIVLSSITTLTPDDYEEHPIGSIEPEGSAGIQRTHTYTFDGPLEALDGYRRTIRRPRRDRSTG